jgi:ABC-type transport system substrate-binding protein
LNAAILPEHILNNTQFYGGGVDYSKIKNSKFNFPNTGSTGTYPVGTGPYMWCANPTSPVAAWSVKCTNDPSGYTNGWNAGSSTAHLTKNPAYFDFPDWGTGALAAKSQYAVKDYFVQNILGSDQAITALNGGSVDFLDSQYHLETQTNFVNSWNQTTSGKGLGIYTDYGVQEMGVNMNHPVLGTGTATPYGQQHPAQAANASMWIRQAISYATPRTQIIQQLLNGYGVEAITTPVVGNWRTGEALTAGFNTQLKPYDYNLTKAGQLLQNAGYSPTYGQNTLGQYVPYIVAVVVIAAVAIAAIFLLRARSHRHVATTTTSTYTTSPPPPPPSSGPPP